MNRAQDEAPRPWRLAPIDPERLVRATALRVESLGDQHFAVTEADGRKLHYVALGPLEEGDPLCDCGDHTWRSVLCQHALAALFAIGDSRVCGALVGVCLEAFHRGGLVLAVLPDLRERKSKKSSEKA